MTDNRDSLAAQQTASLRKLADVIEAHPEIAEYLRHSLRFGTHVLDDAAATFATFARAAKLSGAKVTKDYRGEYAHVRADWGGVSVDLQTNRDEVCERVVTGTREVTEEVPDPDAPKVTITRTVEDVDWVCRSLLAADTETAVA